MASTPKVSERAIEHGMAILVQSFRSKSDLSEFAQTLDAEAVAALSKLIEAIIDYQGLDWEELGADLEEYSDLEWALDAAELLAYQTPLASIPLVVRLFRFMAVQDEELLAQSGAELVSIYPPETASAWLNQVRPAKGACTCECVILDGVSAMAQEHASLPKALAPQLLQLLASVHLTSPYMNGWLVNMAVNWNLTEAAETIERLYSQDRVDCGIAGNWQVVQQKLNVAGLGLQMPQRPIDSHRDFCLETGVGVFSDVPLIIDGEMDEAAVHDYLNQASQMYRESECCPDPTDPSCGNVVSAFLELGLNYFGVHAENMTVGIAREIVLELYPRKISDSADQSDYIINELIAFWNYCDQVHHFERAARIANKISSWRRQFRQAMSDPSNYGWAKSLVMTVEAAGFDIDTEEGAVALLRKLNANQIESPFPLNVPHQPTDDSPINQPSPSSKSLKERKKLLKRLNRK